MSTSYQLGGASVNPAGTSAGPAYDLTPTVEAIGSIHFEGNVTPHTWYQHPLLQLGDGKANLVAITLLADICYWYRPTVIRDEMTGRVLSVTKKFQADKLHWDHAQRAEHFGLTKRQVQDAIAFLKARGLIAVEIRDRWTLPSGATLFNQVFIEPVAAAIQAICGYADTRSVAEMAAPSPPPPVPMAAAPPSRLNGIPPTFKRDTPPAVPGHPSRSNVTSPPLKREPSTKTSTKTSQRTLNVGEPDGYTSDSEKVREVVELTGDSGSVRRFEQLHDIAAESGNAALFGEALRSTRKRIEKGSGGPLERPGAYFCSTLVALLQKRGVPVPVGSAEERSDVRSEIAASIFGTEAASHA